MPQELPRQRLELEAGVLNSRSRNDANYVGWHRGSQGYLKTCVYCGRTIYMCHDAAGCWRPWESWVAGEASEGQ